MPKLRTYKGFYSLLNPGKYVGESKPVYRSSWEFSFMRYLDQHPKVLFWASESLKITYKNPITGKYTVYVPDFFLVVEDKKGSRKGYVIEIKPKSQTSISESKNNYDKMNAIINQYKWSAAKAWCDHMGFEFLVLTEKELFSL